MTFALFAPSPLDPDLAIGLPLFAADESDANLEGFAVATTGTLLGLYLPGNLNSYLVAYEHNGTQLTTICTTTIEEAENILAACLEYGIVEKVED